MGLMCGVKCISDITECNLTHAGHRCRSLSLRSSKDVGIFKDDVSGTLSSDSRFVGLQVFDSCGCGFLSLWDPGPLCFWDTG